MKLELLKTWLRNEGYDTESGDLKDYLTQPSEQPVDVSLEELAKIAREVTSYPVSKVVGTPSGLEHVRKRGYRISEEQALDVVKAVLEKATKRESSSAWQPIATAAPVLGKHYLIFDGEWSDEPVIACFDFIKSHWVDKITDWGDAVHYNPSHWMPLPDTTQIEDES